MTEYLWRHDPGKASQDMLQDYWPSGPARIVVTIPERNFRHVIVNPLKAEQRMARSSPETSAEGRALPGAGRKNEGER